MSFFGSTGQHPSASSFDPTLLPPVPNTKVHFLESQHSFATRRIEATSSTNFHLPRLPVTIPTKPDYGHLKVAPSKEKAGNLGSTRPFGRFIDSDDDHSYRHYRRAFLERIDRKTIEEKLLSNEEIVDSQSECSRNNWERLLFENCNVFHEFTMERPAYDDLQSVTASYLGHGAFRDAWIMIDQQQYPTAPTFVQAAAERFVLKTVIHGNAELKYDHRRYWQTHMYRSRTQYY